MTFFKKLKQNCRYPIYEVFDEKGYDGFRGQFHTRKSKYGDGRIELKRENLVLQANMPRIQKEATLVHELGHARCAGRQCECLLHNNKMQAELHAELYALHFLLKHHRKQALRFRINVLHPYWYGKDARYNDALLIIKTRKIYTRCKKYIEPHKGTWIRGLLSLFYS